MWWSVWVKWHQRYGQLFSFWAARDVLSSLELPYVYMYIFSKICQPVWPKYGLYGNSILGLLSSLYGKIDPVRQMISVRFFINNSVNVITISLLLFTWYVLNRSLFVNYLSRINQHRQSNILLCLSFDLRKFYNVRSFAIFKITCFEDRLAHKTLIHERISHIQW